MAAGAPIDGKPRSHHPHDALSQALRYANQAASAAEAGLALHHPSQWHPLMRAERPRVRGRVGGKFRDAPKMQVELSLFESLPLRHRDVRHHPPTFRKPL